MSTLSTQESHVVGILLELEQTGAVTPTSLSLAGSKEMTYERYEALGSYLGRMNRSCAFWIGDWLLFGEQVFPDRYAQAAEATGLAPQTLANRASVCKHIPRSRRRASLPFAVHAEVAYIEPDEQEGWLQKAESQQWTRAQLRQAMRFEKMENSDQEIEVGPSGVAHTCPQCGYTAAEYEFVNG